MIVLAALPSLLWTVLRGLEQAYIDEGAGSGQMPSLDLWANLLRPVHGAGGAGIDVRDLPEALRVSRRAVRSRVLLAARNGWTQELRSSRSQATVRLTVRGRKIAAKWKLLQGAVDERWRARVGPDKAGKLRVALEAIVGKMPLEHPHYPAGYGAADARITGGNGRNWRAVPRKSGDTVSHLPLAALVSQALVAFAMSYEERSPVALSLTAAVIMRIPPEGRPLQALGYPVGIAALARHGFLRVSRNRGSKVVHLTPKGVAVSEAYDERVEAVETGWRNLFGEKPVSALHRALEGVTGLIKRPEESYP